MNTAENMAADERRRSGVLSEGGRGKTEENDKDRETGPSAA